MIGHKAKWRATIPGGLLGAVAVVLAVEVGLAHRGLDFTTPDSLQYRATAATIRGARAARIVCLGDSLIKLGLLPRVLRASTGWTASNLAIVGGQPMTGYFLLRRALEGGARPKALLVGFKANILQCDPRPLTRGLEEIARPVEVLDLAWTARDPDLGASILLARLVPSYRCRHEIRANLAHALRGQVPPACRSNRAHLRNWAINRGSQVEAPTAAPAAPPTPEVEAAYYPRTWSVHPLNAVYLKRLLKLAEAREVPVYWLLPPIRPDVQARREQLGLDAAYARFVRKVQAAFPRLVVVDGWHSGYSGALFNDPVHLHRRGARAYSDGVAEVLNRAKDGDILPRWIELPGYRDRPEAVVIEDLSQSLQALGRQATRVPPTFD
jgi:hypothetical protein